MLMQGLMEELDDHPGTLSDLEDRFGKAADVAAELQESVPMDEFNQMMQMRKRRTFLLIGATLTIVALGVCFMILYYMHAPYYITSFTQEG